MPITSFNVDDDGTSAVKSPLAVNVWMVYAPEVVIVPPVDEVVIPSLPSVL